MTERVLLAQGREAEVFLQPDGTVLKLMRDPDWADRVEREAAALRAVEAAGYRAARVHATVVVDGRPGLVTDRIEGDDLLTRLGRNVRLVGRVAATMANAHAAIHEVAAPPGLPSMKDDLRARIERAPHLPAELRPHVLSVLDALPDGDRLCHGDFHPGNIMGSFEAPVAIDWGAATRGDPLGDAVRTALLLSIGSPPPGTPRVILWFRKIGGRVMARSYFSQYRRLHPVDKPLVGPWRIVRAAARLAEPIPEETAVLLRIIRRGLKRYNRAAKVSAPSP